MMIINKKLKGLRLSLNRLKLNLGGCKVKKTIIIEYLTPLEFVSIYSKSDLAEERIILEQHCNMPLLAIIEAIVINDIEKLDNAFVNFAEEVGYEYCIQHGIFHEYQSCPLCLEERL